MVIRSSEGDLYVTRRLLLNCGGTICLLSRSVHENNHRQDGDDAEEPQIIIPSRRCLERYQGKKGASCRSGSMRYVKLPELIMRNFRDKAN